MSGRLAALAIGVTLLALSLARFAQVPRVPAGDGPARPNRPDQPPAASAEQPPRLTRDPFRYADEPAARLPPAAPAASRAPQSVAAPLPVPEPIRLSGFVRRGSELKAVLWVAGTTVVVATGESADGYRVLSVDEDAGVRVRAPSGEELLLRPKSAR